MPFHVNCYGSDLRLSGRDKGMLAPPSPAPWRCYDVGRAVAKILSDSLWRVAVIGSSSWSHASLTTKHGYLYPDIESDRLRLEELRGDRVNLWRELSGEQLRDAGQHEMLNWICLAGAMEGRKAELLSTARATSSTPTNQLPSSPHSTMANVPGLGMVDQRQMACR